MKSENLPHNLDAERKVLGAMIRDRDAVLRAADLLQPGDFYQPSHQLIYEACLRISSTGRPIDLVLLHDDLQSRKQVAEAGGPFYLAELVGCVATSVNVEYHAELVKEKAFRRRFIRYCGELREAADTEDPESLAAKAYAFAIECQPVSAAAREPVAIQDGLSEVLEEIQERWRRRKEGKTYKEIKTGIPDLDRITGGIGRGEMWVLAGRPAEGKSLLAAQIGLEAAKEKTVLFISLEMTRREILEREMESAGRLSGREMAEAVLRKADSLSHLHFYTLDFPELDISQIARQCEKFKAKRKSLDLIILDYLQLTNPPSHLQRVGMTQQVSFLSNQCKILARRLECGFLVLSQLNRSPEKDKRKPRLSDLRESGAIEQDADLVMLIYRDEKTDRGISGIRELLVEKNRHGRTGKVNLFFDAEQLRFQNVENSDPWQDQAADENVPF